MIGAILGIIGGFAQFMLLKKLADTVTSGKEIGTRTIILVLAQISLPVCILTLCALLIKDQLLYCGIAMATALMLTSIITFVVRMRRKSK